LTGWSGRTRSGRRPLRVWPWCLLGAWLALVALFPASWCAPWLAHASQGRVQLVEVRGTLWHGQAKLMLTGGAESREATTLAAPLHWRVGGTWDDRTVPPKPALAVQLHMKDHLPHGLQLLWRHEPGGWSLQATRASGTEPSSAPAWDVQLPMALWSGLGAPWNTLQLQGDMALQFAPYLLTAQAGRLRFDGELDIQVKHLKSRVSTLPQLGSYQLSLRGQDELTLTLQSSPQSALRVQGQGQWSPGQRWQFQGEALAAPGREAALSNLLNIMGRRDGDRSVITL